MKLATLLALGTVFFTTAAAAQSTDPSGVYLGEGGKIRVRVAKCGAVHCGTILAVTDQTQDVNNSDASKRGRDVVGLQMLWDIKPAAQGFTGQLYNIRDGRVYSGKATFEGDAMKLSGCVLAGLICRTQIWERVR